MTAASQPKRPLQPGRPPGPAAAGGGDATTGKARPRRSQAQRREESERRLLDAALEIVAHRGFARMTLAEVGEAAGYSRGLPAQRFGSKAGLVHALAGYLGQRFGEQRVLLARRPPPPGLPAILANIRFYFSRRGGAWTATRALLVMMAEASMAPGEPMTRELAAYNRSAVAWFEQHIRTGIAAGQIAPSTDAHAVAVLLLGAMRGVMLQWLVDPRIGLTAARNLVLVVAQQLLPPPR